MGQAIKLDTDMSPWGNGVIHYVTDDGRNFAVSIDAGLTNRTESAINDTLAAMQELALSSGNHRIEQEPTVIMECTEFGEPITLDRLHEFPAGTSHEEALFQAGYEVV